MIIPLFKQSPDGDIIDCVSSHQQPAFDHPNLKGQKPLVNFFLKIELNNHNVSIFYIYI